MKTILIHSPFLNNNSMYKEDSWNLFHDLWINFRDQLFELGYELKTSDNNPLEECEWIFFFDEPSVNFYKGFRGKLRRYKSVLQKKPVFRNLYRECIEAGMENKIALFIWEPPSVIADNWNPDLHKLFPFIFTWNDDFIDNKKFFKIYWTASAQYLDIPTISFKDKKLLVNISMNKSSTHPRELYSERLKSIRHFEISQPENFDLYGVGWKNPSNGVQRKTIKNHEEYQSYRGEVLNKSDVLSKYKFSLCYENIYDEPGFITEKIFDCLLSRCVPIYWGAQNINDYVDENTFINRRDFKSNKELEDYLTGMSENEYNYIQKKIEEYLHSDRFAKFLPPNFAQTIINTLRL